MDYKKMLSLLLAASMAVSMPINVFATQPVTETENQTEVEPYVVDVTAPTLSKTRLSKRKRHVNIIFRPRPSKTTCLK